MNPVLRKDMLGLLRLRRIAALQVLFVAVLAMLVLASWPRGEVISVAAGNQDDLLLGLILGQLFVLVLAVPGVAAVSLTVEKETNTLEMLYASRLSPARIALGKVLSTAVLPGLLLASGLPFVGLLAYRGAVDTAQLGWAYLILIVTAIFLAVLGLTVSAICRQTSTALVVSYAVALIVCGGALVPAAIMLGPSDTGVQALVLHLVRSISPVAAVLSVLRPNPGDYAGVEHQTIASHLIFIPLAIAVSIACIGLVAARLRRPPAENDNQTSGGSDVPRSLARRLNYLIDPKKQRRPLGHFNPVIAKESRTNSLRSGRWMIRILYALLLISMALSVMTLYGGSEQKDLLRHVFQVLVIFQISAAAAVSPSLTTPAFSSEIENGTFETLRLSRLSGGKIFWGKFLPALLPAFLPIIALLPAYGTVLVVSPGYETYLLRLIPVVLGAMVLACILGLLCSAFTSSTARATVAAYIATAAIFVLPLLAWFAASAGLISQPWLKNALVLPSPLVMGLSIHPDADMDIFSLWSRHLIVVGGMCIILLAIARVRVAVLLKQG